MEICEKKRSICILTRCITDNLPLVLLESNHLCEEYYIFKKKSEAKFIYRNMCAISCNTIKENISFDVKYFVSKCNNKCCKSFIKKIYIYIVM